MEQPAEVLGFEKVELRRWRAADAEVVDRVITESRDHLLPWMPWAAGHDMDDSIGYVTRCEEEWAEGKAYNYAITTEGTVVGSCSLMRRIGPGGLEIGYWIHPGWTGRGLMTMAVTAVIRQAFALPGVERVEIHHDEANEASGAVARRLGFTEVERERVPEGPAAPSEVGVKVKWRLTRDALGQDGRLSSARRTPQRRTCAVRPVE